MFTATKSRLALAAAVLTGVTLVAAGCASNDPLAPETATAMSRPLPVWPISQPSGIAINAAIATERKV